MKTFRKWLIEARFDANDPKARRDVIYATMKKFFSGFKKNNYKKYFEDIFGEEFTVDVTIDKNENFVGVAGPKLKMEAYSSNRENVFTLTLTTNLVDAEDQLVKGNRLGSSDTAFGYWVDATAFSGGKSLIVAEQVWHTRADSTPLMKPESVFPKARMQKIAAGKIRSGSKLKKRDFISMFIDKWQCDPQDNKERSWFFTYAKNLNGYDYALWIKRIVKDKMSYYFFKSDFLEIDNYSGKYHFNSGWWSYKNAPSITCGYLPENEETFKFLNSVFEYARRVQDPKKIAAFIKNGSDRLSIEI